MLLAERVGHHWKQADCALSLVVALVVASLAARRASSRRPHLSLLPWLVDSEVGSPPAGLKSDKSAQDLACCQPKPLQTAPVDGAGCRPGVDRNRKDQGSAVEGQPSLETGARKKKRGLEIGDGKDPWQDEMAMKLMMRACLA